MWNDKQYQYENSFKGSLISDVWIDNILDVCFDDFCIEMPYIVVFLRFKRSHLTAQCSFFVRRYAYGVTRI